MATVGNITLYEYNDETVVATLYEDVSKTTPINLTGMTVEFIYKTSTAQADTDATTITATIVSAVNGQIKVSIPNETVDMSKKFYRIDVIAGSDRRTAVYGNISVVDL